MPKISASGLLLGVVAIVAVYAVFLISLVVSAGNRAVGVGVLFKVLVMPTFWLVAVLGFLVVVVWRGRAVHP